MLLTGPAAVERASEWKAT